MNKTLIIALLAGTSLISGCAPLLSGAMNAAVDENAVHEKTATYFATARENIAISAVEKGALSTSYQAKVAGNAYACSIYYGEVNCKLVGAAPSTDTTPAPVVLTAPKPVAPEESSMTPAQAQARLNHLGFQVGAVDGIFGKRSIEKLKLFQKSRGLAVTGQLDALTVQALRNH